MADNLKKHLGGIERFGSIKEYKYPRQPSPPFPTAPRNAAAHGKSLKAQMDKIRNRFNIDRETELPEGIERDDVIYVEFYTAWGFKDFKFDQLDENRPREYYKLLNIRKEIDPDDETRFRYRIALMLREGGVSHFLKYIDQYLTQSSIATKERRRNKLIANIEDIKLATLEAFWTDGDFNKFPTPGENVWWEVWFRKTRYYKNENRIITQLQGVKAQVGGSHLEFAEHVVKLVKGTPEQLASSLMLLDSLAELRKPQEVNDFITHESVTYEEQAQWLEDLKERAQIKIGESATMICLLDTGVNNTHPLLTAIVPDQHLYAWKSDWGIADTEPQGGHGTGMAGLALFGDLTEALSSPGPVRIFHGIESFKIKHPGTETDQELFGVLYRDACNTPVLDRPKNSRIYCITVTNDGIIKTGRPSSSSAAIDNLAFGSANEVSEPQLIIVSGGNTSVQKTEDYPKVNFLSSIQDPGQAYNVLTVGAYTRKDKLTKPQYGPLAAYGGMSPNNTTSNIWDNQWPNKPDLVMEGGNLASDGQLAAADWELSPLSFDKDFKQSLFLPFGGTSGASALAAKMAAELKTTYPDYWPETIRALMVHSAQWTDAMTREYNIAKEYERKALLRSVGYGVPSRERAMYSADSAVTLVSQAVIQPFKLEKNGVQYNQYHLYQLPWPKDVLEEALYDKDVSITVTLSYFIEPNPGGREYANNFSYHSHSLDFNLIRAGEKPQEFERRISKAADWPEGKELPDGKSEPWTIKQVRSRGSVKKDFWNATGAELAERNILAIYPKKGWYKTRKKLERYHAQVRYSLVVSIETKETEVDIYTPVKNMVATPIPL